MAMAAVVGFGGPGVGAQEETRQEETQPEARSAEETLRSFIVAMMLHEDEELRELVLPTEDFDWLLIGPRPPEEQEEDVRAFFKAMPIRALEAGDVFELPTPDGVVNTVVGEEEVTEDRAVLLPEDLPAPIRLRRIDGQWRVDARPVIAARKAADAARKAKEGRSHAPDKTP